MSSPLETFKRIQSHPGVVGALVIDPEGLAVRTTMDNTTTQQYKQQFIDLTAMTKSAIRDLDPTNEMKYFRIRSKNSEIMVVPENDYLLIVTQNVTDS